MSDKCSNLSLIKLDSQTNVKSKDTLSYDTYLKKKTENCVKRYKPKRVCFVQKNLGL